MSIYKFRNIKCIIGIVILMLSFGFLLNANMEINALENKYANEFAYYRVEETLEEFELYDGLSYKHDSAYSSITDETKLIGNECGGAMYGPNILELNKEYTQSAHILTLDRSSNAKVVVWSVVRNGSWRLATIIETAKDYEAHHPGYKVVAGINGDFFDINATSNYPYTISGAWVSDGEVYKPYASAVHNNIAFNNDDSEHPYTVYTNEEDIYGPNPVLSVYDEEGNIVYETTVNKVNNEALAGEVSLHYSLYNNEHACKGLDVENAYIVTDAYKSVAFRSDSFYGKGEITEIGNAHLGANQFAIKSTNTILNEYLKKGVTIRVQYEFQGALGEETEVSGYVTTFLKDGQFFSGETRAEYMDYRYPRTLIGYASDGTLVMTATDGRQPNIGYYGLNGVESAAQMSFYGCEHAISLDGGGSTTMVILKDGELVSVNSPSDGGLRSDGNAIFIVVPVPEVEMSCESTDTSISVTLSIVNKIEEYKSLYIEVNGEKKKYEDKTLVFDGLRSNTKYAIIMYGETEAGDLVMIPIQDSIKTTKSMFSLDFMDIQLVEIDGVEYYKITWDITDADETIINLSIKIDKYREFFDNTGSFLLEKKHGSPTTMDAELSIMYSVTSASNRETYVVDVSEIYYKDAKTFASSVNDRINKFVDEILE